MKDGLELCFRPFFCPFWLSDKDANSSMAKGPYQQELATEVVYDWILSTEKVIGSIMKKRKVVFSETNRRNITIKLIERAKGLINLDFFYRDSLRFTDMGAGRGYHKGVRISQGEYIREMRSRRRRKRILMKPIFGRLNSLMEVVSAKLIEMAELDFGTTLNLREMNIHGKT